MGIEDYLLKIKVNSSNNLSLISLFHLESNSVRLHVNSVRFQQSTLRFLHLPHHKIMGTKMPTHLKFDENAHLIQQNLFTFLIIPFKL